MATSTSAPLACAAFTLLSLGCQSTSSANKARPKADTPEERAQPQVVAEAQTPTPTTNPERPALPDYDGPPKTVLVELFTSQGCNSCPPADAFIGQLASLEWSKGHVIPLTFHVTYWDDLGWKDPYAKQLFDQRQIGYAQQVPGKRADDETTMRGPYTPQMVVDGRVHFSGTLRDTARDEVTRYKQQPTLIELEIDSALDSTTRTVTVKATSAMLEGAGLNTDNAKIGLFAALAENSVQTEVPRGENAGKKLDEFNVVRDFQGPKLFRSHRAKNETEFEFPLPEGADPAAMHAVVFIQDLASLGVYTVREVPLVTPS